MVIGACVQGIIKSIFLKSQHHIKPSLQENWSTCGWLVFSKKLNCHAQHLSIILTPILNIMWEGGGEEGEHQTLFCNKKEKLYFDNQYATHVSSINQERNSCGHDLTLLIILHSSHASYPTKVDGEPTQSWKCLKISNNCMCCIFKENVHMAWTIYIVVSIIDNNHYQYDMNGLTFMSTLEHQHYFFFFVFFFSSIVVSSTSKSSPQLWERPTHDSTSFQIF